MLLRGRERERGRRNQGEVRDERKRNGEGGGRDRASEYIKGEDLSGATCRPDGFLCCFSCFVVVRIIYREERGKDAIRRR